MTSTFLESLKVEKESASSTGSSLIPATTLGIMLAIACHSSSTISPIQRTLQAGRTLGTVTQPSSQQINQVDQNSLLRELSRVYDELLTGQVEMDADVRVALYSDLWSLYD